MDSPPRLIQPGAKSSAVYHEWDERYPEVAKRLVHAVAPTPPWLSFEDVGSTSIPGCGGKGVIDLLALYDGDEHREAAKNWLLALGFGKQGPEFARPWPETRPMYLGTFVAFETRFLLYVHVVNAGSDEVRRFRQFRERLLADPSLVTEYNAAKRAIIAAGVSDTDTYAAEKRPFMHRVLGADHALRAADAPPPPLPPPITPATPTATSP